MVGTVRPLAAGVRRRRVVELVATFQVVAMAETTVHLAEVTEAA